jgi:RNA polymerase sigma factor (sigma-70 family)
VRQPQKQEQFKADLDSQFRLALVAYFLKRTGNRTEAEDLTQDVLVKVLNQADAVDIETARAYIFTAAANLLRDRIRQSAARRTSTTPDFGDTPIAALVEEISPERVLMARQTLKDVLKALGDLSERTRDIFVLYRIEKMKQHEIASLYGLSHTTVERHLARAVAFLAERFDRP